MPTPTVIADLSTTIASNFPSGSNTPSVLDDVQRAHAAFIAQLRDRTATDWPNTPAGGVTETTVQGAINGLETRRAAFGSFKNKLINGAMLIDQRNSGAAQSIVAAAALAYTVDRWYGYCTGANATGQQVAGTAPNKFNYRYTGAPGVTKIAHAQRMEAANTQDLAGTTATLSVDLANSLLTAVTWTAWYANTEDAFGSLAAPTRTQIATGIFTVTPALSRHNAQISIPTAAITGLEIELSVGAQTSGTWTIGRAQLEAGAVVTAFAQMPYGLELGLCQRYFETLGAGGLGSTSTNPAACVMCWQYKVPKRISGVTVTHRGTYSVFYPNVGGYNVSATGFTVGTLGGLAAGITLSSAPPDNGAAIYYNSSADQVSVSCEL